MIVNAHTHLYSALVPLFPVNGEAADEDKKGFLAILESLWWRLDRALDERSLRAAARLYLAEARLAGTDVVIDHHESPNFIEGSLDVIADACQEIGVSALLCYGATERNGGAAEARRGLDECRRFIVSNRRPHVRGAVGLHAAFTVSDETMRAAGRLCRELGAPLHVHVAEDAVDEHGFARLAANDALVPGSILAHGVYMNEEEVGQADRIGCWLVQNPRSNRANGVGYPSALRASSRVALGTDGFPSNLDEEAEAIRHRESADVIARRVAAGERLAGELGLRGLQPATFDINAIRADAAKEAENLWEKMNESQYTVAPYR
ncbi:MAG TPA: amidohydrolase family protein [Thermoanaerobaculia bacterium]|nr:amidohydrolase family protein [Thermoanaerobaculia bacterium]